jgi:hypothetical protein
MKLLEQIYSNDVFDEWGLKITQNMAQVKAKKLFPAKVLDDRGNAVDFKEYSDGRVRHTQPIQMGRERWAMIYSPFDFDLTTNCFQML